MSNDPFNKTSRTIPPGLAGPRRVSGFTLIELLIVIGITGLLIALGVIGFRVVGSAMKSRVTTTAMENCKGLMAEFTKTVSPEKLLDPAPVATAPPQRWLSAGTGVDDAVSCRVQAASPGTLNERYLRDETARVINRLRQVPENRQSIEKMSPDRLMAQSFPVAFATIAPDASVNYHAGETEYPAATQSVVLLDGSSRPIYFIPGGGLTGVRSGYHGPDRTMDASYDQVSSVANPVRSPDHQPFWASPGPDGDLTTGDDNEYSFGK